MDELSPRRWSQFSYASLGADAGVGSGGWHVAEHSSDLEEAELALLRRLAVTQYDDAKLRLPQFPTPEDIEQRPCWFRYQRTEVGAVYVHAAPAGPDASLRPKNVFNHVLVDRAPDADDQRPIMLWGSPTFLAPYGAEAVGRTRLPASAQPQLPGRVTRESAIDFLLSAAAARPDLLAVLLDAVRAVVQRGRPVVLVSDDASSAAHWIAAVSMLTTPQWARLLHWSLFETADGLDELWRAGVHLAVVPHDEAPLVATDGSVVVIDELALHQRALAEGPLAEHRTAAGQTVAESAWSRIALHVLGQSPDAFGLLSDLIDEIGEQELTMPGCPEWPLAMAALHERVPGSGPVVAPTIEYRTPMAVLRLPWLMQHVVGVISEDVGDDAAAALARLSDAQHDPGSLGYGLIYRGYLIAALGDGEFQFSQRRIPLPEPMPQDVGARQQLIDAAVSAMASELQRLESASDASEGAVRSAAILDLCLRLDLLVCGNEAARTVEKWFDAERTPRAAYEAAVRLAKLLARKSCSDPHGVWSNALAPCSGLRDLFVAALCEALPFRAVREIVQSIALPSPPSALGRFDEVLRKGSLEEDLHYVPALLFEVAECVMETSEHRDPEAPYAAVLLHGACENQVALSRIFRERDWKRAAELELLKQVEARRPGWIPSSQIHRLAFRNEASPQLTSLLAQRYKHSSGHDDGEARLIRLRRAAERYTEDPRLLPEMAGLLQDFVAGRAEARLREHEEATFGELPSAGPSAAASAAPDRPESEAEALDRMLGIAPAPEPVAVLVSPSQDYPVNPAVFAPLVVAACVQQEIFRQPLGEEARRACAQLAASAPSAALETALLRRTVDETGRLDRNLLQSMVVASLSVNPELGIPRLAKSAHDYSCTAAVLSADPDGGRRGKERRTIDLVLARICAQDEEAAEAVNSVRVQVESLPEAVDDHRMQNAIKQHFARILPKEGGLMGKTKKFMKNPFGKGS